MPDPVRPMRPGSTRRLEGFSKQMQEAYGGFAPKRMQAMLQKRIKQFKSVPNAIGREAEITADAVGKQAKKDFGELKRGISAARKKLGL